MSLLSQVTRGKLPKPRRTMLYSTKGLGKSTFGSMAEKPVFIDLEDGLGDIDCARFPRCRTYQEFMAQLAELYTAEHDFKTVVVDTLDWLEQLVHQEVCRLNAVQSIESIGYGKGYAYALKQWREIIDGLTALREQRGMGIILLAHAGVEKYQDPQSEGYDRYVPCLHKTASAILQEWCDEVLFAQYRVFIKKEDQGFNKTRATGISTGERIIRTEERPAHVAKNRLSMPFEIALDYREYAKYFVTATTTEQAAA